MKLSLETAKSIADAADLRSADGSFSETKIATLFGVEISALKGWHREAASFHDTLKALAGIAVWRIATGGDAEMFRLWLRTPHCMLENKSPGYWIERGRAAVIADFVADALGGSPS